MATRFVLITGETMDESLERELIEDDGHSNVAVVTGASRGIGAAIARRLARAGMTVVIVGRTVEPDARIEGSLRETAELIVRDGGRARIVQADLTRPGDQQRLVDEVLTEFGRVDVLVNNAAASFVEPTVGFTGKRFDLMFDLQVRAPYVLSQMALPGMIERGRGWVLNISSRAAQHPAGPPFGSLPRRGFTTYGMCKAALERMTTGLAAELHGTGVCVNALAPWDNVATPGTARHGLDGVALEGVEVMAEAAHLLTTSDITGRIAYSIPLLVEHEIVAEPL